MNENIKQLYEDKEKTIEAFPRIWMPIGSLYWNENDISSDIDKYFIGTWVRYAKGKFIVSVDENDTDFADSTKTGGEKVHTLTISEMPAHAHSLSSPNGTLYADINSTTYITMSASGSTWMTNRGQISMGNNGGGQSHNNLPPFQAAYCWKRIS